MDKELSQQAIEARRKYHREWNRAHPEKLKEYDAKHWEKVAAQAAASNH